MGPSDQIECAKHGTGAQAFLCHHLIQNVGLEFHRDEPTAENPYPDAWCRAFEEVRRRAGGWDGLEPASAPPIRLVCGHCHDNILAHHLTAPRRCSPGCVAYSRGRLCPSLPSRV
jgi:hypothetical protein